MSCTNCGQPSAADYCAVCAQFRERLEELRAAHRERRRRMKLPVWRVQRKSPPGWWLDQAKAYARAGELPLTGQDAALPVGDRE